MTREEAIDILRSYLMFDKSNMQIDIALNMAIEALKAPTENTNTPSDTPTDLISRQDAIEAIASRDETDGTVKVFTGREVNEILSALPSADRPIGWIPVIWHEITDEERNREGYPKDWVVYIDCEMPSDEQKILVTTRWGTVEADVCYEDGEFSLDSGLDWIDDIIAWMPLPKPYREDGEA